MQLVQVLLNLHGTTCGMLLLSLSLILSVWSSIHRFIGCLDDAVRTSEIVLPSLSAVSLAMKSLSFLIMYLNITAVSTQQLNRVGGIIAGGRLLWLRKRRYSCSSYRSARKTSCRKTRNSTEAVSAMIDNDKKMMLSGVFFPLSAGQPYIYLRYRTRRLLKL